MHSTIKNAITLWWRQNCKWRHIRSGRSSLWSPFIIEVDALNRCAKIFIVKKLECLRTREGSFWSISSIFEPAYLGRFSSYNVGRHLIRRRISRSTNNVSATWSDIRPPGREKWKKPKNFACFPGGRGGVPPTSFLWPPNFYGCHMGLWGWQPDDINRFAEKFVGNWIFGTPSTLGVHPHPPKKFFRNFSFSLCSPCGTVLPTKIWY